MTNQDQSENLARRQLGDLDLESSTFERMLELRRRLSAALATAGFEQTDSGAGMGAVDFGGKAEGFRVDVSIRRLPS